MASAAVASASNLSLLSSSSDRDSEIIELISSDDVVFQVTRKTTYLSETISHLISDINATTIPLDVPSKTLAKIIEWMNYHVVIPPPIETDADKYRTDNITDWEKSFMNFEDMDLLFSLLEKTNYLHIQNLLQLVCKTIANHIKGLAPEDIVKKFKLPD